MMMDSRDLRTLQEAYNEVVSGRSLSNNSLVEQSDLVITFNDRAHNELLESVWENVFCGKKSSRYTQLDEVETKETQEGTKYKVIVKDRKSGSSYVRFATREKIAQLRANPNIASVELKDTSSDTAKPSAPSYESGYNATVKAQSVSMAARMAARDRKAMH